MRLRPYKNCDAEIIAGWVNNEDVFLKWGGDRFGDFPICAADIEKKYQIDNGDCAEDDNFYPWIAFDDKDKAVGHFIMRYLNGNNKLLRFGWVIVDDSIRGKGYGTQMLRKGLDYAFNILGVEIVTIGVFENNTIGHECYKKVGFLDKAVELNQPWNIIEMEISKKDYLYDYDHLEITETIATE